MCPGTLNSLLQAVGFNSSMNNRTYLRSAVAVLHPFIGVVQVRRSALTVHVFNPTQIS